LTADAAAAELSLLRWSAGLLHGGVEETELRLAC